MNPASENIREEMYGPPCRRKMHLCFCAGCAKHIVTIFHLLCCCLTMTSIAAARSKPSALRKSSPRDVPKPEKKVVVPVARGSKKKPRPLPVDCVVPRPLLMGFGSTAPVQRSEMYSIRRGGSGTGSVTTKSELGLTVTDFFDYTVWDPTGIIQGVTNYFWSVDQNLFENGLPVPYDERERTFCRVRSLKVFVLPVKGFEVDADGVTTGPNQTNASGQYTVNCQVPGISTTNADAAIALNTQVTNVLPQIDTMWKQVLSCNLQKTFESAVARPFFDDVVDPAAQCLFQMSIVDPTDGTPYLPANGIAPEFAIRVKVVLQVDQPIATIQNAVLKVFKNEDFTTPSTAANGPAFSALTPQYVQMNLRKKQDHLR